MATPKVPTRPKTRRPPQASLINGDHPRPAQKSRVELVPMEEAEPVREESGLHLHWEGRRQYRSRIPIPRVLEPDKRLSLGADSENLVIEGDNLQVMVSLRSQFNAAVDICYIDPPYNRGGNDFRYSDARFHDPNADDSDAYYVSNEDGGRHTKWLNYLAPRLALIYELLADNGILFASISDNELFRLGMLLDEIFDERNRIGVICWRGSADNNPTRIAIEHEYILCYAKHVTDVPQVWASPIDELKDSLLEQFAALKREEPDREAVKRKWRALIRANKGALGRLGAYTEIDEHGPYQGARRVHNPKPGGYQYNINHPVTKKPTKRPLNGYRYPEPRMRELIAEGRIVFGRSHEQIVQMKDYLDEYRDSLRSVIDLDARAGINTLKALFGKGFDGFRNPKPVELMERLVGAAGGHNALVMDPFAGSGTTGHAVMRLNKQDGGDRRFILIEEGNGDDRYARTLLAPRLKKAVAKEGLTGGFTFLKAGRALDREAILGLEREKIVNVICQTDRTGTGSGIRRVQGHTYLIGANKRSEAISLCWNGRHESDVTGAVVDQALKEVSKAGLKTPMRIYGTTCRISETRSFTFCQIPDEILASLYLSPLDQNGDHDETAVT
jgi:adenine-specific DNA-methyltransferase